jgi:alkanesulfonate monooxygenase SsuD/methylene tetrahydromethanopterin reductase-like flavin-dependent oxidoreductase (luciferase family)
MQPRSNSLADRVWYGGSSAASVHWAGTAGVNLLTGNILSGEGETDFASRQVNVIREYRGLLLPGRPGRVALGRVIVPFDSADRATRKRYAEYEASRHERTLKPQGPKGILIAQDVVGTSDEIVERLLADPAVNEVTELRMELPYEFSHENYEQILHDMITSIAPHLGWTPAIPRGPVPV